MKRLSVGSRRRHHCHDLVSLTTFKKIENKQIFLIIVILEIDLEKKR